MLNYIDRFGAEAVMGRTLGAGEIRRMVAADNVLRAYRSRAHAENWAKWAAENPALNRILNEAIRLADDGE